MAGGHGRGRDLEHFEIVGEGFWGLFCAIADSLVGRYELFRVALGVGEDTVIPSSEIYE